MDPAMDELPLSLESISWMQRLAREHEAGRAWVSFEDVAPSQYFRPLIGMGLVEQGDISFQLTDLGWWALGHVIKAYG